MSSATIARDRCACRVGALLCAVLCALALTAVQAATGAGSAHTVPMTTDVVTGTVYISRGETSGIACAYQANRARSLGVCLEVKFVLGNPAAHRPDVHRGSYCRGDTAH